jgi:hypothetical protein
MAEVPKVGESPIDEFGEYDGRALDVILNDYSHDETPRLGITPFRTIYLPLLAKTHPRRIDIDAVRLQWQTEVARSNRLPVFITADDDKDKILYRVPPLIGTVHTGLTATETSMDSLDRKERELKDRLSSMGEKFRKQKFAMFNPNSSSNREFQLDWVRILLDFGYLGELKSVLGDGPYPEDITAIIGNRLDNVDTEQEPDAKAPVADGSSSLQLGEEEEYDEED